MNRISTDIRRKLIQIAAFGFSNSYVSNLSAGRLYTGSWKKFCSPGLNCYSCPAARMACPIGAMQAASGSADMSFGFYAAGIILAFGVVLGRAVCGFLCPFGLLQELINRIPSPRIRIAKPLTYVKYVLLVVFVLLMPALVTDEYGIGAPAFCEYICPAGTLEGGLPLLAANTGLRSLIGGLFTLKAAILILTVIGCVFCWRFFCKVMCPLGAIYGLMNRISIYHMELDSSRCVSCGTCARVCPMDTDPVAHLNSAECIRCGRCISSCPGGALSSRFNIERNNN